MRKLPVTITEQEFLDVVKAIDRPKYKLAFMLGFYQCMRVSEVAKLMPNNVDMERGYIHILAGKGNKDRDIPIMPPVIHGIRHLPVGIKARQLQNIAKRYFGLKFHTLRHSGATYYLNEKRLDIRHIQQLLGHSRLDTTQIYTHVTPKQLKTVFDGVWQ